MADTAEHDAAKAARPRPLRRRRRMLGILLTLVCAAGIALASSAVLLAWGAHDEPLTWLSLFADVAVVILAAELALRGLRKRSTEAELLELSERHGKLEKSISPHYASLTVDHEGSILTWSEGAEELTGYTAEQSIGNTFSFLLPPVSADIGLHAQLLRSALQSERATTECWLMTATGERRWIHLALAPLLGEDRWARRFLLVLRDMSETEGALKALREHEASLERILDSAADAIITADEEQRIVMFNPAAERLFQLTRQQAIGQPLDMLLPERFRVMHRQHVDEFGSTGITARRMGDQTTLTGLRADGREFPIEASISHALLGGRKLYTVILRDVTERVHARRALEQSREGLRELALALQTAREEEKSRIARELHDELGQSLTALRFDIAWLAQTASSQDPALQQKLHGMAGVLDHVVAQTRRISADLHPLILDDLGFGAAAEWLVSDFKKRTGTACDCRMDASVENIAEPLASALFRALQELLTNVARHAHASRVDVQVVRENGAVQLEVRDNGKGITDAGEHPPDSSGLRSLSQRAMMLGGEAKATRMNSGGTRVVFRIPVNGRSEGRVHS